MRFTKKLPSLQNVAAGATAVQGFPIGVAYEMVKFKLTNVTPAQMKNLKLVINGRTVQTFKSGEELQEINAYKKYAADATGYLSWYFVMPELKDIDDQRLTKLGTKDVQTLAIEFDIDSGVMNPAISATALVSNNAPLGVIKKVLRFSEAAAVAGINEISNIPTNGARISAIHFKKSDIKSVEVEANGSKVYEAEKAMGQEFQKAYGKVPNANYTHVDWILEGRSGEAFVTAGLQDFRFKLDHTASGAMEFIVEYIDVLNGGV